MSLAVEAKQFLRSTQHGILSTISTKFAGYPFGSVTPFMLDHHCQPIILISSIAEHTKNIIQNPKVSLLVFAKGDDLQANARLTLIGEATKIPKDDADLMARYSRYFPESVGYFAMHDFAFYRINIAQARYIAGFGKMGWVTGDEIVDLQNQAQATQIATIETDMIAHMNEDHNDSMLLYCKHFYQLTPQQVSIIGIDCDGFDIEAVIADDIKTLRFNFESPIFDANSARAAFVSMTKLARV
jgi:heme iron utilization protein